MGENIEGEVKIAAAAATLALIGLVAFAALRALPFKPLDDISEGDVGSAFITKGYIRSASGNKGNLCLTKCIELIASIDLRPFKGLLVEVEGSLSLRGKKLVIAARSVKAL